jgi:beta-galactosidase
MTAPRTRQSFDEDWSFYLGDITIPESVKAGRTSGLTDVERKDPKARKKPEIAFVDEETGAKVDPAAWRRVSLPHDWCVEGDITRSSSDTDKSHGFLPRGVGFYRKVFSLPAVDRGRKVVLEFDGVFRNCRIWFNGQILRDHRSGYTSFEVDLTDDARYGDEGENCVLVRVDARDTEGWWYEGCGIYRHVWLRKTHRLHVSRWGVYVTTPKVSAEAVEVKVETTLQNEEVALARLTLVQEVRDGRGKVLARTDSALRLEADGRQTSVQKLRLKRPALWSPESPSLYRLVTRVFEGKTLVDEVQTSFGVRRIEFKPDGFYLNGKHTLLKGTCNHQDFAGVGVALPDSLHEYKIRLLREMGSNAYRCAHHPPAPELLDVCDRLGMLVMDENRQLDSSAKGLSDLESMILRDRNHPSIIFWSLENEEPLQGTPRGARIVDTLARRTRQLDPTRPTVSAMNKAWDKGGYAGKMEFTGFNYGHRDGEVDVQYHRHHPGRLMVGTETTACTTTRGEYRDDKTKGYWNAYGDIVLTDPWMALWTCRFETPWQSLLKHPFLTGMFVWTGFDYRGEPSPSGWPCVNSHFGIMDTCGFPKDCWHYYKANWTDEPVLHVFPHWNWKGKEGKPVRVMVLTNCGEVELFLNGKSLGRKKAIREDKLEWQVPYAPGELKAIGSGGIGGKMVTVVKTTGPAAALRLVPDRTRAAADGKDAVPVRVEVVDKDGLVVPTAGQKIEFKVSGPGRLIGVGNGDPICHEPNRGRFRSAFHGLCLAIIQSAGKSGEIRIEARAKGLKPAVARVRAV